MYGSSKRFLALLLTAASLLVFACPVLASVETANEAARQSTESESSEIIYDPAETLIEQSGGDIELMQSAIGEANAAAPSQSSFTSDMPEIPFDVDIIDKSQTVVVVVDEKKNPIAGATVKIKKTGSDNWIEKTSESGNNKLGKAYFTMSDIGSDPSYTSLSVTKQGYREFFTQEARFTGGAFRYVTLVKDDGKPYFSQMDFDKWDFQYAKSTLSLCSANDAEHTFDLTVKGVPNGQSVEISLAAKGAGKTRELKASGKMENGVFKAAFKGQWCNSKSVQGNNNAPFSNGQQFTATIKANNKSNVFTTNLRCENAVLDKPVELLVNMCAFGFTKFSGVHVPDVALPVVRGKFGDTPVYGYHVYILPSGRAYVGINMELEREFKELLGKWKTTPDAKFADWEADSSKLFRAMQAMFENKALDYKNPTNNFLANDFGGIAMRFKVDFYSRAFLVGRYQPKTKTIAGEMAYMGGANMKVKLSKNIPYEIFTINVGFDVTTNPELSYKAKMGKIDPWREQKKQQEAEINPAADITLAVKVEVGISGSVGIPDLAAAGARGYMFVQPKFQVTKTRLYQRSISLGIGIQLFAELAGFVFTATLWGKAWTYDNQTGKWYSRNWWFENPQDTNNSAMPDELTMEEFIAAYNESLSTDPFADAGTWSVTSTADLAAVSEISQGSYNSSKSVNADVQTFDLSELSSPVAADYGERSRIMPKKTTQLAKDVYSDARIRVVPVGKLGYVLFRIVMASVDGKTVARLAYSSKQKSGSWSEPKILCPKTADYTNEYWDLDYDVFGYGLGSSAFSVTMLCGKGDNRTPDKVLDGTALFAVDVRTPNNGQSGLTVTMQKVNTADASFPYISLLYSGLGCISYAAQQRPGLQNTGTNAVFLLRKNKNGAYEKIKIAESEKRILSVKGGISSIGTKQNPKASMMVGYLDADGVLRLWQRPFDMKTFEWDGEASGKTIQNVSTVAMPRQLFGVTGGMLYVQKESIPQGSANAQQNSQLDDEQKDTLYRGQLYLLSNVNTEPSKLKATVPLSTKLITWTDPLFSIEVPCWFENVIGKNADGNKVEDYTLHMMSVTTQENNKLNLLYTKEYVYSNLKHAVNSGTLYSTGMLDKRQSFGVVYTNTENQKSQKANLYDAELQAVRSVDILGIAAKDPCIVSGGSAEISLQAKNLGNVLVESFIVKICSDEAGSHELTRFAVNCKPSSASGEFSPDEASSQDDPLASYLFPGESKFFKGNMQVKSQMGTGNKKLYAFVVDNTVQSGRLEPEKDPGRYRIIESDGKLTVAYSDGYVDSDAHIESDGMILEALSNTDVNIFDNPAEYVSILTENENECPQVSDVTPGGFGLGHDDLELIETTQMLNGKEYVSLRVINNATLGDDTIDGSLGAQVHLTAEIDGREVSIGSLWLKRGEGATLTLPLSKLTGGSGYGYIIFTASTDDEFNAVDNTVMLGNYPAPDEPYVPIGSPSSDYSPNQYGFKQGTANGVLQKDGSLLFEAEADCEKFVSVSVDGVPLERDNYTEKCGSTIVIIHKDYIDSLKAGEHTVRIQFIDGYAQSTFTKSGNSSVSVSPVAELPATGGYDGTGGIMLALWLTVLAISIARHRKRPPTLTSPMV